MGLVWLQHGASKLSIHQGPFKDLSGPMWHGAGVMLATKARRGHRADIDTYFFK